MSEWWTYRLSDFLLFSADTYYRLFELYNLAIWPAHVLVIAVSIWAISILVRVKPWSGRALFFLLAAIWFWVAWGYHVTHFASINWAASYYAIGFALQGVLLIWAGVFSKTFRTPPAANGPSRAGIGLAGFGLILQPFIGPLSGRPWTQVELFGIAPDPTVVVTLGLILIIGRSYWLLLPIPIIWCLISSATLWTMDTGGFWIMAGAALIALIVVGKPKPPEAP